MYFYRLAVNKSCS